MRELVVQAPADANQHIGPNSYDVSPRRRPKPGRPMLSSKTPRFRDPPVAAPPATAYNVSTKLKGQSSAEEERARRFPINARPLSQPRVHFLRKPTPSAIPSRQEKYGYHGASLAPRWAPPRRDAMQWSGKGCSLRYNRGSHLEVRQRCRPSVGRAPLGRSSRSSLSFAPSLFSLSLSLSLPVPLFSLPHHPTNPTLITIHPPVDDDGVVSKALPTAEEEALLLEDGRVGTVQPSSPARIAPHHVS